MRKVLFALFPLQLVLPVVAQQAVVIPAGTAHTAGDAGNAFPWGWAAVGFGGLRHMSIYDSGNLTDQSVLGPIVINRLRWRPDQAAAATSGGVFQQADVRLSTAPMNYTQQTANFAANHGADLTTVYSGPVTYAPTPGAAAWTPQTWCIDVQFSTPFFYDPAAGDLVIDCEYLSTSWQGGVLRGIDVQTVGSRAGRTWASSTYPNVTGSHLDHGVVVEVGFTPAAGYANALSYGLGCGETATETFYELFPYGAFDLSNTAWQLVPTAVGYVAQPAAVSWHVPTGAPIPMQIGSVAGPFGLGFTLQYPGGSTSQIWISSNGFVWPQASTIAGGVNPVVGELLTQGARWCPLWGRFDPAAGGQVQFDVDALTNTAYVTFTNVPEVLNAPMTSTFQLVLSANGAVEYRFQSCSLQSHEALVGWSPGMDSRDPGSADLSASTMIVTSPDLDALTMLPSARPVLGTAIALTTATVSPATTLGATVMGLGAHSPGIDLTPYGMPSCRQFVTSDAIVSWTAQNGVGSTSFAIPGGSTFAGVVLQAQGIALEPGVNPTGAATTNGLRLFLDLQ